MKIGIDARLYSETGVGRYIANIISQLQQIDHENEYVVYMGRREAVLCKIVNEKFIIHQIEVPWHTIREQIIMPWYFIRDGVDLVHAPYFTIPIFFPKKIIVTVHDLILSHFTTGKASTLPFYYYALKRIGYEALMRFGLFRASKIIAVSHSTARDIEKTYGYSHKILTIPEGIDHMTRLKFELPNIKNIASHTIKNFIKSPYILYVGNAYPHKNLEILLQSFSEVVKRQHKTVYLALVGKNDYFYSHLQKSIDDRGLSDRVKIFHDASDEDLSILYEHAVVTASLSLSEGFGFPVLEALVMGSRILCSDIAVFHEVAGSLPIYVDPKNIGMIAQEMMTCMRDTVYKVPSESDISLLVKSYKWKDAASQTKIAYGLA
ncbi:glycosyltransferase family 4 protein [Candidatus Gottesmanbacteria bacterium]|nr:glycosyltransferase family 4 protein [Candidatus Gottesmanbacteria bacterium]